MTGDALLFHGTSEELAQVVIAEDFCLAFASSLRTGNYVAGFHVSPSSKLPHLHHVNRDRSICKCGTFGCAGCANKDGVDGAGGRPEHLAFALGQLRSKLVELGTAEERAAWRALAASSWLRAGAAGVAPRDAELDGRYHTWLRAAGHGAGPLAGEPWRELFRQAEGELE